MTLEFESKNKNDISIITLKGVIDIAARDQDSSDLKKIIAESKFVIIDLSHLNFIDSCGLGLLIAAKKAHREAWGTHIHAVKVVAKPGAVSKIIRSTHLDRIFHLFDTLDECLDSFPRCTVLVIQCDKDDAVVTEILLEANGYTLLPCESLKALPDESSEEMEDVGFILVDTTAVDGSDKQTVENLRRRYGVPVGVLVTDKVGELYDTEFVVQKPYDPPELLEQIMEAVAKV